MFIGWFVATYSPFTKQNRKKDKSERWEASLRPKDEDPSAEFEELWTRIEVYFLSHKLHLPFLKLLFLLCISHLSNLFPVGLDCDCIKVLNVKISNYLSFFYSIRNRSQ